MSANEETAVPLRRALTLLCAGTLTIMAGATVAPSLPAIEARFADTDNAALLTRLVVTLPALFIALCAPLAGRVADRYGRRPLLLGAVLLYALAGTSGLLLDTLPALLAGRALLGVAVAGIMTTATALAGDYFSGAARDRFMGLQSGFVGLSGLLFLTAGGLLAETHWRAPFAVYGAALLLLPAIAAFIVEPRPAHRGDAGNNGEGVDRRTGLLLAALFAAAVLNSVCFYLVPTQLPFHLQSFGADAPTRTGLAIGTMTLLSALSALAYAPLRRRFGQLGVFGFGFGLVGGGFLLAGVAPSYAAIVAAMAVTGIGLGTIMPNLSACAMTLAPPALRGRIAGGLTASIFLGHFLSPLASQPLIEAVGFAAAFRDTGLLLVTTALLVVIAAARRPSIPARSERLVSNPLSQEPRQ